MSVHEQTAVAYIVNSFHRGGLERCVARLVEGLEGEWFRPVVVCLTESGGAAEWIGRDDVPVIELHKRAGNDWRVVRRLAEVLRRQRVDIVHSHNWGTLVETSLARRWAKVPVHVHAQRGMFHHGQDAARWRQAVRRAATRWACRRADAVVAVADSVRDDLIDTWGVPAETIEVIPNGVAVPEHDDSGMAARRLRASLGIPVDAIVAGSVGRLAAVKDFPTLLRAMTHLGTQPQDVHLVIVGEGSERGRLQAEAAKSGIPQRLHLVGEQSNVGDWLSLMDIYVNCSLSEGMSQSILEAMAMGLPLVVTDVGENAALVGGPGGCGHVVPVGCPEELAGAIASLLPAAARMVYGNRARDRHQSHYALETMLAAYEDLYLRLRRAAAESHRSPTTAPSFFRSRKPYPIAR